MNFKMIISIVAVAVMLVGTGVNADEKIFQDGLDSYAGTEDNYLSKEAVANQDYNNGGKDYVKVVQSSSGPANIIMRFDVSSLAGKTITGAKLELYAYNSNSVDQNVSVYEILSANKDWVEGTITGNSSQNGSSCWNYEQYTGSAWDGGQNGCGVSGTDRAATAMDTVLLDSDTTGTWFDWTLTNSVVQGWADGDNAGVVFIADSTAYSRYYLASSEYSTATLRPKLTITYTPEPATMLLLGIGGLGVLIRRRRRG
ncbi:MAG: DNRLRE domain-containing protein [Phycisphaerae bacterium]|nr:DNRLRE domain-containing protein [Phycisphaerae bacterium]